MAIAAALVPIAAYLAAPALASATSDMSKNLPKIIQATDELKQKFRWIHVTIANETQFNVRYTERVDFEWGRFFTGPGNTNKFNLSAFSVCNKDHAPTGVSGKVKFELEIPGKESIPISIAFSNPPVGDLKIRAEFTDDMEEVFNRMEGKMSVENKPQGTSDTIDAMERNKSLADKLIEEGKMKHMGEHKTEDGGTVNVCFKIAAAPGNEAKVTITQCIGKACKPEDTDDPDDPGIHPETTEQETEVNHVNGTSPEGNSLTEEKVSLEGRDLVILINLLTKDVAASWNNIGLQLGFTSGELTNIQGMPGLQHQGAPAFFQQMLTDWLKWYDPPSHPPPTIEALARAIKTTNGSVAQKLKCTFQQAKASK